MEERSSTIGDPIDNSQLSRFEKGKAYPSFDKLRVLARIFNVSVQNFSDIIDLEQFDALKPPVAPPDALMQAGWEAYDHGEYGRSYVTFEQALECAGNDTSDPGRATPDGDSLKARQLAMAESEAHAPRPALSRRKISIGPFRSPTSSASRDLYLASVTARGARACKRRGRPRHTGPVLSMIANVPRADGEYEEASNSEGPCVIEQLRSGTRCATI